MATTAPAGRTAADKTREALGKLSLFRQATPELKNALLAEAAVVHLGTGTYFLREGDSCEHFAMLVSGRMRVYKQAESGHEITLYNVGPGEACPLNVSCILSDRPVPATARVEEDVEAVVIPATAFRHLMAEHGSLRAFVFEMLSTRLAEVMSLVEEVAFRRMDQRLARRLQELLLSDSVPLGSVAVTHAGIAADLGTAREVVSRLLKEFERLGAITLTRGRIGLKDGARLREIASRER